MLLANFLLTLLGLTSILISILEALLSFTREHIKVILGMQSVLTLLMLALVLVKYFKNAELNTKQLIRRKRSNPFL
jgi:maltodextrin utilization protein YvdJ